MYKIVLVSLRLQDMALNYLHVKLDTSCNSSVDIATDYRLDGRGSIPGRGKDSSPLHSVKTDSESKATSYSMGTEAPS
jgi:hypothetical protein